MPKRKTHLRQLPYFEKMASTNSNVFFLQDESTCPIAVIFSAFRRLSVSPVQGLLTDFYAQIIILPSRPPKILFLPCFCLAVLPGIENQIISLYS